MRTYAPRWLLIAVAVLSGCTGDSIPTAELSKTRLDRPSRLSAAIDGETFTVDATTRQLIYENGTAIELPEADIEKLATALEMINENVYASVDAMTSWALAPDYCNDPSCYMQSRKRGKSPVELRFVKTNASKGKRHAMLDTPNRVSPFSFVAMSVAGPERHTAGACPNARHPSSRRSPKVTLVPASAQQQDSPCKLLALKIYDDNNLLKDKQYMLKLELKIAQLTAEDYNACLNEQCRTVKRPPMYEALQIATARLEEEHQVAKRLQAASKRYDDMGCWNPSSHNWIDSFLYPAGGGSLGSGFTRTCSDETWQISFDGGFTWFSFTVETCVVDIAMS